MRGNVCPSRVSAWEVWHADVGFDEIGFGEYWAMQAILCGNVCPSRVSKGGECLSAEGKCSGRLGTFRLVLVKYAVGNIGKYGQLLRGNVCPLRVSAWGGLAS